MFLYPQWENFCRKLHEINIHSTTAKKALHESRSEKLLILKHDVETDPEKALKLAKIEHEYGHTGVYYVQAYLLKNKKNINILREIQSLGHEVSYHHDVMDSNKGDIAKADAEFQAHIKEFELYGFNISTVCQHGNPIVERIGYNSNRDFFRNGDIAEKYKYITEIMVNFKERLGLSYQYISDTGYGWKVIFDPETNDIVNSDDKNIKLDSIDNIILMLQNGESLIVSTHPHRWEAYAFHAKLKNGIYRCVKRLAKFLLKIKIFRKVMEKNFKLAKKI
ncbi:MAG: hypothetical protein PHH84_05955 [Oscillospiraceae bacterium]|nr:hypothetical protein [Oscillospiraceae bacterium]MDD4413160.1 hypothetical protein [Oscillospiraceae bacterium]